MVMRGMQSPTELDQARLVRVVRSLLGAGGVAWLLPFWENKKLYGLADSDHASDEETRRSVSSSQEYFGSHILDTDVNRQQTIRWRKGLRKLWRKKRESCRVGGTS